MDLSGTIEMPEEIDESEDLPPLIDISKEKPKDLNILKDLQDIEKANNQCLIDAINDKQHLLETLINSYQGSKESIEDIMPDEQKLKIAISNKETAEFRKKIH